jgi:3-hydroxyisobutyrate dehydrogenase-like beta-hydroxyacid dehydrogenase
MAANIAGAGYSLTVFDLDQSRMLRAAELGARIAADTQSLVRQSDVIITSLPGPRQVRMLAEGPAGLIANIKAGATWIDMTTNDPALVREMAPLLAKQGAKILDAPVTGAVDGAKHGTLSIFVGGEREVFNQHLELLKAMGKAIFHCGDIGAGNVVKLVTNQLWFVHAAAIGEGLALGHGAGVDLLTLWNAIKASVGNSFVAEHDVPSIFAGHYDPSFTLDLCMKDLDLIHATAASVGVPLKMTGRAREVFNEARETYGGSGPELLVAKLIEDATGTPLQFDGNWVAPWLA